MQAALLTYEDAGSCPGRGPVRGDLDADFNAVPMVVPLGPESSERSGGSAGVWGCAERWRERAARAFGEWGGAVRGKLAEAWERYGVEFGQHV